MRPFNLVGIEIPIKNTKAGLANPDGAIFALADEKAGKLNGSIPFNPLIIRANAGDCVHLTLTSEMSDTRATDGFSKINLHVHHVQFDPQASDGVISGFSYEQSVRPYKLEDPQLTSTPPLGSNLRAPDQRRQVPRGRGDGARPRHGLTSSPPRSRRSIRHQDDHAGRRR